MPHAGWLTRRSASGNSGGRIRGTRETLVSSRHEHIEFILDHYENPRNRGRLDPADVTVKGGNPGCGDVVTMYLNVNPETKVVEEIRFEGEGCTISQAGASVATEIVKGKTIDEIEAADGDDLVDILGREVVSNRLRCAVLGILTARAAVRKYRVEKLVEQIETGTIGADGRALGLEFE